MRLKLPYSLAALALFPLILFNWNSRISPAVHNFGGVLLKPFLSTADGLTSAGERMQSGLVHFWQAFRSQERLEREMTELRRKVFDHDELRRENERLKQLLNFKEQTASKTLAARVIGWDISPWRRVAILDRGTRDGLRKDMPVVSAQGLVGHIYEAGLTVSRVMVLQDPESRVSAIAGDSRSQGVVAGDGSSDLTIEYLESDSKVALGETILSSGATPRYPKGIPIGTVESLSTASDGLHLMAAVKPFVAFNHLEEVLCLDTQASAS